MNLDPEQVHFTRLKQEHLEIFLEIRNECRNFLHNNEEFTLEQCQAWFSEHDPEFYLIEVDDAILGYFRVSNHDENEGSLYIGADLHQDHRGKGYARPLYQAFIAFIRKQYQLSKLLLEVLSSNERALHLYLQMGFKEIKREKNHTRREGQEIDNIYMQMELEA